MSRSAVAISGTLLLLSVACAPSATDGTLAGPTPREPRATASPANVDDAEGSPRPAETTPDPSRLDDLTVAPEQSREGYSRERFKHWSDLDGDGCDTRREVLIAESLAAVSVGPRCTLIGGLWFSPYDGRETTRPTSFDIDHFVPLAEAWDSGANEWSDPKREGFANDLDHPDALIAVTASSNRSKSDQDPAEWMPPRRAFWCTYATIWVEIKVIWELTVDESEIDALRQVLSDCTQ